MNPMLSVKIQGAMQQLRTLVPGAGGETWQR